VDQYRVRSGLVEGWDVAQLRMRRGSVRVQPGSVRVRHGLVEGGCGVAQLMGCRMAQLTAVCLFPFPLPRKTSAGRLAQMILLSAGSSVAE
jgi:hypothetical protein